MKVKVCGLKHYANISDVVRSGADYVGLIFYKNSPRYVNDALSFDEARQIDGKVKKVGVFVNEDMYSILNEIAHYNLDMVQLHGNEDPAYCRELRTNVKVVKAFGIDENFNFQNLNAYKEAVDYFLFDTATPQHGGSGKEFDHQLLEQYNLEIPFFLSGGISVDNIQTIKKLNLKQLFAVDINSKFEVLPGVKDINKVKQFIDQLK